ncbi:MAG: family 10 glycosylhydrolase [Caldithrix sp.]|nr:family 10 glycosylhydrolase [Caldithrix sp.]
MIIFVILLFGCVNPTEDPEPNQEVRGVWLTNVDSDVLDSRENIAAAMTFLKEHHFNLVCPVVWNGGRTLYPSTVMDSLFQLPIDAHYTGRDPLQEVIEEAHKRGIAVYAWFEFGFAASYQKNGGHIVDRYPHWAARDIKGALLSKNGFEWMNGYHPQVQQFMIDLVMEVVNNYTVDGVQGDDRLPAQPSEGGYSSYTVKLYEGEHHGRKPPRDHTDSLWLKWRADKLNAFAQRLYQKVKQQDAEVIVSWAPSIHPWAYEQYLQDWPSWIEGRYADVVFPQQYRHSFDEYKALMPSQRYSTLHLSEPALNRIYPGILMKVGDYVMDEAYLKKAIQLNRRVGVQGEVFFFYEGLRENNNALAELLLNTFYTTEARLPDFTKNR